jgi:hypothetical protein
MELAAVLIILSTSAAVFIFSAAKSGLNLKRRLISKYVSTRELGEKIDLITSLSHLRSKKALKIFMRELCAQVPIFLSAYYDEGASDVVREKIASALIHYSGLRKNYLKPFFHEMRKLISREKCEYVASALVDTLAVWAKRLDAGDRKLLLVSIKYRLGITERKNKLLFIHLIKALISMKKELIAASILKNSLFLDLGSEINNEIKIALKTSK